MRKRAVFLVLLGAIFASVALAAPKDRDTSSLSGKFAGGGFFASITLDGGMGSVNLSFNPEPLPDGRWGYYAHIDWYDGALHEIYGLVPASTINFKGVWGPIQVNITHDAFIDPSGSDPAAFSSLEGTFTVYTGPGSGNIVQTGSYTGVRTEIDGGADTMTLKGIRTDQSATFEGMILTSGGDSYAISVEGFYPNAHINVSAGTTKSVLTPPPGE